jgi:hypothetical protein
VRRNRPPYPSTPPFSWLPLMSRPAMKRVESIRRPKRHPALGLRPGTAKQHPAHRGLQIVITNLVRRRPTQPVKRINMPLQIRLLALSGKRSMHRPPRKRQPHREQRSLRLYHTQDHPQIVKIHPASTPGSWRCGTQPSSNGLFAWQQSPGGACRRSRAPSNTKSSPHHAHRPDEPGRTGPRRVDIARPGSRLEAWMDRRPRRGRHHWWLGRCGPRWCGVTLIWRFRCRQGTADGSLLTV